MPASDHCLLHFHPVHEQLTDSPAIAVGGDATQADGPSNDHGLQIITGCQRLFCLSTLTSQFWSLDAGRPDPFTFRSPAGVAVTAAAAAGQLI